MINYSETQLHRDRQCLCVWFCRFEECDQNPAELPHCVIAVVSVPGLIVSDRNDVADIPKPTHSADHFT